MQGVCDRNNKRNPAKPTFTEMWEGLQRQFYAPIDSSAEIAIFYQMKQHSNENIFSFLERVSKQAYFCNFSQQESGKHIAEIFARNPAFFLASFDKLDNLDNLKYHARNFHAALPKSSQEPVLAINNAPFVRSSGSSKQFYGNNERKRMPLKQGYYEDRKDSANCNYCGENCNRRRCPTRGKRCNYCDRVNHLERACFRKKTDQNIESSANAVTERKSR